MEGLAHGRPAKQNHRDDGGTNDRANAYIGDLNRRSDSLNRSISLAMNILGEE